MNESANDTILETLRRLHLALSSDSNALTSTRAGEVNPPAAYVEILREILSLGK